MLRDLLDGPVGSKLDAFLMSELARGEEIYPALPFVFSCLNTLPPSGVRVVILGQDPYHQPNQATGRAFEVPAGTKLPPSLVNIYKLVEKDLGVRVDSSGLLSHWETEGVLLLNTVLTVNRGQPESHRNKGWERVTDRIIEAVAATRTHTAFLLWGEHAKKKAQLVRGEHNLVLVAPHPSPLSAYRGFFDCNHFSRTNRWLRERQQSPIQWSPH